MKGLRYPAIALLFLTVAVFDVSFSDSKPDQPVVEEKTELGQVKSADLMTVLSEVAELGTFAAQVRACGLDSLLREAGPFTLFVPEDSALAGAAGESFRAAASDAAATRRWLSRCIVPGRRINFEQSGQSRVTALDGGLLEIEVDDKGARVGGAAVKKELSYTCSNGVIHVLKKLIEPGVGSQKDNNR